MKKLQHTPQCAAGFILVAVLLVAGPAVARAQFLGAWLPPERTVSGKVAVGYSDNDSWFCGANLGHCEPGSRGHLSDLVASENTQASTLLLQAEVAPLEWLAFTGQIPFHDITYTKNFSADLSSTFTGSGVGDVRLVARAGRTLGSNAVNGGYALTLPSGSFDISANLVPVGQGTRNHDFFVEAGHSFWPARFYVEAGALYRVRETFTNEFGVVIDWGNEIHGRGTVGYTAGSFILKLATHGFRSDDRTSSVGEPEGQFRSRWELIPSVVYEWKGRAWVDFWMDIPMAGRNTPADVAFGLALTYRSGRLGGE